jgi:DNA polymerase IV
MERTILHFHTPLLAITLERTLRPELKGRPVAIALSPSPGARIAFLSPEAQKEGVLEGMTVSTATKICPPIVYSTLNYPLLFKVENSILKKALHYTPLWEYQGIGSLYIDLTGTRNLWGRGIDVAHRLRNEIKKDLGLSGSAAVASNKLVSAAASRIIDIEGDYEVQPGQEAEFMGPLPVEFLPALNFMRMNSPLKDLNISLIREVVDLGIDNLGVIFGSSSQLIYQQALGIDNAPVYPGGNSPAPYIIRPMGKDSGSFLKNRGLETLTEEFPLGEDENDDQKLLAAIYKMIERAASRLRIDKLVSKKITLTIRYTDKTEGVGGIILPRPSFWEFDFYPSIKRLFARVYKRRVRLRHIRLSFEQLCPEPRQLCFLSPHGSSLDKKKKIIRAIDTVRNKFGDTAISFGHVF